MGTIGDVRINVLLDNSTLNESIRTALSILKVFNTQANEIVSIKLKIDISDLQKGLDKFNETLGKMPSDVEVLKGALNGLQSTISGIGGKFGPVVDLMSVFYQIVNAAPPEIRILIGAVAALTAGIIALGAGVTVASGGLNILLAAVVTGVSLIISGISDLGTSVEELETSFDSAISKYKATVDEISSQQSNIELLVDLHEKFANSTVLTKEQQQALNEQIQTAGLLYPSIVVGVDAVTGQYNTNADAIKKVIDNENELIRIRQQSVAYEMAVEVKKLSEAHEDEIDKVAELEERYEGIFEKMKSHKELIKETQQKLEGYTNSEIAQDRQLSSSKTSLQLYNQQYEKMQTRLEETGVELNKNSLTIGHLRAKYEELISTALQTGTIGDLFTQLTATLGSTGQSVKLLQGTFASMSAETIKGILGVTSNMKNLGEITLKIQQILALASSSNPNYGEIGKLVNEIRSLVTSSNVEPKIKAPIYKSPGFHVSKEEVDENLKRYREELGDIQRDIETAELEKRANTFFYHEQKAKIDALFDIVALIKDQREGQEAYNSLLRESNKITESINSWWKEIGKRLDNNFLKQQTHYLEKQLQLYGSIVDNIRKIESQKIALIDNNFDKKRAQINRNFEEKTEGLDRNIPKTEEYIENESKLRDKALSDVNAEQFEATVKSTISIAQNISNILGLGAETFVAKLLGGLQSGISLANSILQLLANLGTGGLGGGIFGLVGKIFGFAQGGHVPGFGSGDTVPAMLTPGEFVIKKGIVDKLGSSFFAWINGGLLPSMAGHYGMGGIVSATPSPVVNNSFDVHIDRRGDVHVVQKALQKLKSNNRYFGG
ncbi:MAG: hypothetical protein KDC42_00915 [Ignavibacteriae bacterium]|nr:hypothetical protein [Ignavibacteriota bacterium]